jgi:hypothetical protein
MSGFRSLHFPALSYNDYKIAEPRLVTRNGSTCEMSTEGIGKTEAPDQAAEQVDSDDSDRVSASVISAPWVSTQPPDLSGAKPHIRTHRRRFGSALGVSCGSLMDPRKNWS